MVFRKSVLAIMLGALLGAPIAQGDAQQGGLSLLWEKRAGGSQGDVFHQVISLPNFTIVAVGSSLSVGAGRRDAWVVAFDSTGERLWEKTLGGARDEEVFDAASLSQGLVAVGTTSSEGLGSSAGLVAAFTDRGKLQWKRIIDTPQADAIYSVATLPDGDIVVAGSTETTAGRQGLLARLSESGEIAWQRSVSEISVVRKIAAFRNGDLLLIGEKFEGFDSNARLLRVSLGGDVIWTVSGGSVMDDRLLDGVITPSGDVYAVGQTWEEGRDEEGWLLRVSGAGQLEWDKKLGAFERDSLTGIQIMPDQTLLISGVTEKGRLEDPWVLVVTPDGRIAQSMTEGSALPDGFNSAAMRSDGSIVLAGYTNPWEGEPTDGLIAMVSASEQRLRTTLAPVGIDQQSPTVFVPGGGSLLTTNEVVEIAGNVIHKRPIKQVVVNGRPARLLPNGAFYSHVPVVMGTSEILVEAIDDQGLAGSANVRVTRSVGQAPDSLGIGDFSGINFGKYYAIVIGNNDYKNGITPLDTAIKDASEIARVLRDKYGFQVDLLLDATAKDIRSAFDRVMRTLRGDDNLLVYYAGHGHYEEGSDVGYWLPVDANLRDREKWIPNSTVTDLIKGVQAKHVLLVADSCFSGTLLRSVNSNPPSLAFINRMAKRTARLVMSSGGVEPVMDGGGDGHSVFARNFMYVLEKNESVMDGTSVFQSIREPVILVSEQVPQYGNIRFVNSDGGDFLFVRKDR